VLIGEIFFLLKGNLEIRQSREHKAMDVQRGSEQYVRHAERVTLALLRRQQHNGLFERSSVRVYSPVGTAPLSGENRLFSPSLSWSHF
jgi:hypothetical protein